MAHFIKIKDVQLEARVTKKTRSYLSSFRKTFFREKYRFDQGNAFLVFLNFALLVVSLVHQGNGDMSWIKYYIIGGFLGTWFLGYILDRVVRIQDIQERVALTRSPIWQENFANHDKQNEKLELLIARLERIENRMERTLEEENIF